MSLFTNLFGGAAAPTAADARAPSTLDGRVRRENLIKSINGLLFIGNVKGNGLPTLERTSIPDDIRRVNFDGVAGYLFAFIDETGPTNEFMVKIEKVIPSAYARLLKERIRAANLLIWLYEKRLDNLKRRYDEIMDSPSSYTRGEFVGELTALKTSASEFSVSRHYKWAMSNPSLDKRYIDFKSQVNIATSNRQLSQRRFKE